MNRLLRFGGQAAHEMSMTKTPKAAGRAAIEEGFLVSPHQRGDMKEEILWGPKAVQIGVFVCLRRLLEINDSVCDTVSNPSKDGRRVRPTRSIRLKLSLDPRQFQPTNIIPT